MEKPYKFYAGLFAVVILGLSSITASQAAIDNQAAKNRMLAKLTRIRTPFVAQPHKSDQQSFFSAQTFWGTVQVSQQGEIDYVLSGCNDLQEKKCLPAPSVLKESLVKGSTKKVQGGRISPARVSLVQKKTV